MVDKRFVHHITSCACTVGVQYGQFRKRAIGWLGWGGAGVRAWVESAWGRCESPQKKHSHGCMKAELILIA